MIEPSLESNSCGTMEGQSFDWTQCSPQNQYPALCKRSSHVFVGCDPATQYISGESCYNCQTCDGSNEYLLSECRAPPQYDPWTDSSCGFVSPTTTCEDGWTFISSGSGFPACYKSYDQNDLSSVTTTWNEADIWCKSLGATVRCAPPRG